MRVLPVAALVSAVGALAVSSVALGATSTVNVTVNAGTLQQATGPFQALTATLGGGDQTLTTTPAAPWTATDGRGTGAPWGITASATDLAAAGGATIPSAKLAITTGAVAAQAGSDPATGIVGVVGAPFTVPTGAGQTNVALLAAPGPQKGTYQFTPTLAVTVPGNAQAAAYTATLTLTIS
jgi:hypothetical protein